MRAPTTPAASPGTGTAHSIGIAERDNQPTFRVLAETFLVGRAVGVGTPAAQTATRGPERHRERQAGQQNESNRRPDGTPHNRHARAIPLRGRGVLLGHTSEQIVGHRNYQLGDRLRWQSEYDELVNRIRRLPGFARFLLPAEPAGPRSAADGGRGRARRPPTRRRGHYQRRW
jgi:hypothetical protein